MKALAMGKIIVENGSVSKIIYNTFDGSELTVTRTAEGKYMVNFGNTNWFSSDDDVLVTVTGYGYNYGPCYASVRSMDKNGFEVWTGDDPSLNDGSFTFIVMNMNDGILLNK